MKLIDIHPKLVIFPPSLLVVILLLEAITCIYPRWKDALRKTTAIHLFLLLIFSFLAYLSGQIAVYLHSSDSTLNLIKKHAFLAKIYLLLSFPLTASYLARLECEKRQKGTLVSSLVYFFLLLLSFFIIAYTSYLGGKLVFQYGVGVAKTVK